MKKIFFLSALTAAIITSCKKDDNIVQPCPIQQSTVAGKYVVKAITYKASSSAAEQDYFAALDPCLKDDTLELKQDSSVTINPGELTCPGPPPPGTVTVWYVSGDGKQFSLDALYDIVSFDCTTLVVSQKNYLVDGDTRSVTYSKE